MLDAVMARRIGTTTSSELVRVDAHRRAGEVDEREQDFRSVLKAETIDTTG